MPDTSFSAGYATWKHSSSPHNQLYPHLASLGRPYSPRVLSPDSLTDNKGAARFPRLAPEGARCFRHIGRDRGSVERASDRGIDVPSRLFRTDEVRQKGE